MLKPAGSKLPRGNRLLGAAIEHAPMGFMAWDEQGRLVDANRRVHERLGYSPEELIGLHISELDAEHDRGALDTLWRRLCARPGGRPEIIVTRHRAADGEIFPVETRVAAITWEDRILVVMLATAVTPGMAAQEKLREQEKLFHQVFQASEDAVLLLEGDDFIDCNEAAVRMLRCRSKDEVLPAPPWGLSPEYQPDGRLSSEKAREMIETARRKHFHRFEWIHRRADGEDFPVEVTLTLVEFGGREILHVVWNDITERKRNEQKIERLARYDLLTGLPNRRLLQESAEIAIEKARRDNTPLGVMYMDLDQFKDINDTQGHDIGDHLLSEVAVRLRECIRDTDTVARLGGDEFAFLLPGTDIERMQRVAERIVETFAEPFHIEGISTRIGASIGLVSYPLHGQSLAELLKHADIAMYQAKGKSSGYCLFEPAHATQVLERVNLERDLREAIANRRITLEYQPIINASNGRIRSVEALARWQIRPGHPIPPSVFIATAEASGLIHDLGALLLEEACEQSRRWRETGISIPIALNLSPLELQRTDLAEQVIATLNRYGLDGSAIEFEITESAAMTNARSNIETLGALRKHGIGIAIDDFGTGYSSLSYLKQLPVSSLKVDQSFVGDMIGDPADADIVETIVLLAGSMNLETVAEGVETVEQFHATRRLGCTYLQGYLLSRPAPEETITPQLERGWIELPGPD
ncbi:MAG: putative bifunctional diguanylate cyclase/phosphodiesterase [Wenzhouxiangella sp.]